MSANKENQESEQAELQSVASPRISSTGAGGSEDAAGTARAPGPAARQRVPQGYDHHDWVHWGGVGQRVPHDARSVASSAAADRDDKSIFEEPGALDAHSEGEEEVEEDGEEGGRPEDDEQEEPVEISLSQVQEQDAGAAPLRTEVSNVESAFTAISGPASLADVVDHLADQAVAGELSPRQAAAAIRSATRQHSGGSLAGASAGGGTEGEGAAGSPSAAVAEAGTEVLTMDGTEGSDSVSVSGGVGRSSLAPSEEGWHQGVGSAGRAALLGGSGPAGASPDNMENIALDEEAPAAAIPEQQAEQEPSEGQQATGDTPADPAEDAASEAGAVAPPAAAPEEAPTEEHPAAAEAEHVAAPAPSAVPRTSSAGYKSQLMQQLTDDAGEGEDITVYSRDMINTDAGRAAAAAVTALQQDDAAAPPPAAPADAAPAVADPQALPISNGSAGSGGFGAAAAAPAAPPAKASPRMESLSVEAGSGAAGGSGTMSTADTAAALSAINAAGAAAAPAGEQQQQVSQQQQPAQLLFPPAWYETFKGLLYMDGVDALGRPVVVLNADAVPANMKSSALIFVKAHLEPLVNQGDYVIVFTSRGQAKLPSMWIMGAWRSLPRPFRKHVQYIVLVRPSAFLRAVLAFMRPFVSKKAGRKIKQVQSVHEIAAVTDGEVTVQSLGTAFAADLAADEELAGAAGDASP
ncbi:hypothetical protein ABPG77_011354 [Micractinium sp. CCAP 211/92]